MNYNDVVAAADSYDEELSSLNAVPAIAVAGVTGMYNSVGEIYNAISNTITGSENNFAAIDTIDALDSLGMQDAKAYAEQHRQGVEALGVLAGSIGGGLGALRLAQGARLFRAVGLETSALEKARKAANLRAAESETSALLNKEFLAALRSGLTVNIAENAVASAGALAVTHASPIYDGFDAGDYAAEFVSMTTFGTVLGTAASTAKTTYQVTKAKRFLSSANIPAGESEVLSPLQNVVRSYNTGADVAGTSMSPLITKAAKDNPAIARGLQDFLVKAEKDGASLFNIFGNAKELHTIHASQKVDSPLKYLDMETGNVLDDAPIPTLGDFGKVAVAGKDTLLIEGEHISVKEANTAQELARQKVYSRLASDYEGIFSRRDEKELRSTFERLVKEGNDPEQVSRLLDYSPKLGLLEPEAMATKARYAAVSFLDTGDTILPATAAKKRIDSLIINDQARRSVSSNSAAARIGMDSTFTTIFSEPETRIFTQLRKDASYASGTQGFITFSDAAYGSYQAFSILAGRTVAKASTEMYTKAMKNLAQSIDNFRGDIKAQDEYLLIRAKLHSVDVPYFVTKDGSLLRIDEAYKAAGKKIPAAFTDIDAARNPAIITPKSKKIAELFLQHAKHTFDNYTSTLADVGSGSREAMTAIAHHANNVGLHPLYMPPLALDKYRHFALIRRHPDSVLSTSRVSAIVAKTAEDLERKIEAFKRAAGDEEFLIIRKDNSNAFHQAMGDYNYAAGINDPIANATLRKAGILAENLPLLSSNTGEAAFYDAIEDLLRYHKGMSYHIPRELLAHHYKDSVAALRMAEKEYDAAHGSIAGKMSREMKKDINNPFRQILNQMFDKTNFDAAPEFWKKLNEGAEYGLSRAINAYKSYKAELFERLASAGTSKKELEDIMDSAVENARRLGFSMVDEKFLKENFRNQIAQSPTASRTISRMNGLLSLYMLGADFFQGVSNFLSASIGIPAELNFVLSQIEKKSTSEVGKLAELKVKNPDFGTSSFSMAKLHARSIKAFFFGDETYVWDYGTMGFAKKKLSANELLGVMQKEGLTITELAQYRQMVDSLSFTGGESAAQLDNKLLVQAEKLGEFARKVTLNELFERMVRFMAAHSMRVITDEAIAQGLIKSEAERAVYINTAVNRAHGNYIASQRPLAYQGPIGQTIGLFLTYVTNFMQHFFRYLGSDKRAAATMASLQSAIYGLRGLPGFDYVSTHLVGEASGNDAHTDLYATVNSAFNKEVADWLLYGAGSNILGIFGDDFRTNVYTRGDINPHLLPTSLEGTVQYNIMSNFASNALEFANNAFKEDVPLKQSFLLALQHNAVNRPLAGLGVALAGGKRYDKAGKLVYEDASSEFLTVHNTMRMLGARPMEDAVAADAVFRNRAYDAFDRKRIEELAKDLRIFGADGNDFDPEAYERFLVKYSERGGNPKNFRRFFIEKMKDANQDVVSRFREKQQDPQIRNMLEVIGGAEEAP